MSVPTTNQITRNYLPEIPDKKTTQTSESVVSKDQFLKLLIAQMKYQDPLNPMTGTEFTAQLAQFTSLEQLYNVNTALASLQETMVSQGNIQAASLIGKEVRSVGETLTVAGGEITSTGTYSLGSAATEVLLEIYDQDGTLLSAIKEYFQDAGFYTVDWNGKDFSGSLVEDGTYYFSVTAQNSDGPPVNVTSFVEGQITGLTFNAVGAPVLLMDGLEVNLADIIRIMGKSQQVTEDQ